MTEGKAWVMDGNYGGTMDLRLAAADTIIFLDLPPLLCLLRVVRRQIRYRNRTRPDMAPGCPEKLDPVFLKWIWNYRRDRRPGILGRMERYAEGRRLVHLQTPGQVRRFLETCGPGRPSMLTTDRLILREFAKDDWQATLAYQSNPLYLRYLSMDAAHRRRGPRVHRHVPGPADGAAPAKISVRPHPER